MVFCSFYVFTPCWLQGEKKFQLGIWLLIQSPWDSQHSLKPFLQQQTTQFPRLLREGLQDGSREGSSHVPGASLPLACPEKQIAGPLQMAQGQGMELGHVGRRTFSFPETYWVWHLLCGSPCSQSLSMSPQTHTNHITLCSFKTTSELPTWFSESRCLQQSLMT